MTDDVKGHQVHHAKNTLKSTSLAARNNDTEDALVSLVFADFNVGRGRQIFAFPEEIGINESC